MKHVFDHREAIQEITIFLCDKKPHADDTMVHPLVKCDDEKMSKFLFSIALLVNTIIVLYSNFQVN